jgi:hypothetical protein
MRSVFAAFLWHEGIMHDAMACASFLKFHPLLLKDLPKQRKLVLDLVRTKATAADGTCEEEGNSKKPDRSVAM